MHDQERRKTMNALIQMLAKSGLLTKDLDYHLIRASMVLIFLAFGYQKWFAYEAQVPIPYISNGSLIFWMYPVFGIGGASWFLGVSEWLFGALLFLGFWNKRLGIPGSHRVDCHVHHDGHHYSVHAEWLGSGRRISGNGRQCPFPDEGCRPPRGLDLLTLTGRRARA
jgi:hypothetical protein